MSFRNRLTVAFIVIAVAPLAIVSYGVHREMTARLDADAVRRVDAVSAALTAGLAETIAADRSILVSLASDLAADNRFRIALAGESPAERRWLLDWASMSMKGTGFAVLELQDSAGRVLSSGQFRNDYDRVDPILPLAITASATGASVLDARTPAGTARALPAIEWFTFRGQRFTLLGGHGFDSARVAQLSTDRSITVKLAVGDAPLPEGAVPSVTLPYVDEAVPEVISRASLFLLPDSGPTRALKAGVNRWVFITLGSTLLAAIAFAMLLGRRSSAPIAELADKTSRLDLDALDQKFGTGRDDEIGALERTLDAVVARLRTSVSRLREAERAAATGDLARQINHDIKNGLVPIRNVLRHLSDTAERDPGALAAIYAERRGTLESGVEYLDELARNYARLSPALNRGQTDPRPVVLQVAQSGTAGSIDIRMPDTLPKIRADAVVLHRILDNLVSNAIDAIAALDGTAGRITLGAEPVGEGAERRVRFTVTDTGRGMTRQELDRAFNDFYTTKPAGTGLGLSVVRRLLTDLGGSIKADTAPGEGSTFTVEIPAA